MFKGKCQNLQIEMKLSYKCKCKYICVYILIHMYICMTIVAFYHILIYFTLSSKVFFIFIFYAYAFPHIRMKLSFVNTRLNLFLLIRSTVITIAKKCVFSSAIYNILTLRQTLCVVVFIYSLQRMIIQLMPSVCVSV